MASLFLSLLITGCAAPPAPQATLNVDTTDVLREHADQWIGIDVNYLRDNDANRPAGATPLADALKDMGVRWLRYPGGEKSDFCLFGPPPYDKAAPISLKWYAGIPGQRLDLDAYITMCRDIQTEPFVVVGCDNQKRTGKTWDQWLEHAVAEVNYANKVKGYHIRYWEIGNENWNNETAGPKEMADIVARFSDAMKKVDPDILVGASVTEEGDWCEKFLPAAAPHLDFITASVYNAWGWKSYDYWPAHPDDDLLSAPSQILSQLDEYAAPADRDRIHLIVTETNSRDYSKDGWKARNTIGHALVTFETFGRMLRQPRIDGAMFWTTRWTDDTEAAQSQWYALDPQNQLLPVGQSVALWGKYLKTNLVAASAENAPPLLTVHASAAADGSELTVWVMNAATKPAEKVRLSVKSPVPYSTIQSRRLSGKEPNDAQVKWEESPAAPAADLDLSAMSFPPLSVTVLSFSR